MYPEIEVLESPNQRKGVEGEVADGGDANGGERQRTLMMVGATIPKRITSHVADVHKPLYGGLHKAGVTSTDDDRQSNPDRPGEQPHQEERPGQGGINVRIRIVQKTLVAGTRVKEEPRQAEGERRRRSRGSQKAAEDQKSPQGGNRTARTRTSPMCSQKINNKTRRLRQAWIHGRLRRVLQNANGDRESKSTRPQRRSRLEEAIRSRRRERECARLMR